MRQCSNKAQCIHPEAAEGWLPEDIKYFETRKDKRGVIRWRAQCRACRGAQSAVYRADNKERIAAYKKRWNIDHPGYQDTYNRRYRAVNLEELRAYDKTRNAEPERRDYKRLLEKQRYWSNPESYRARNRSYYLKNHARLRAYGRDYRRRRPEVDRVGGQRKRARKRTLPATMTTSHFELALAYFDYRCAVCGKSADFWTLLAQDHWIPLSKGGATTPQNIVPLCHAKPGAPAGLSCCNNSKHDKLPNVWLNERFGKDRAREISARIEAYFESLTRLPSDL